MLLLIVCSLSLIIIGDSSENNNYPKSPPAMYNFKKTNIVIPLILFALMYQLQLPSVAELIMNKEQNLERIIRMVTITSFFFYSALGVVIPFAIENIDEECALNFRNYAAGYSINERPF